MFAQSGTMLVQDRIEHSWRDRLAVPTMVAGAVMTLPWVVALLAAVWQVASALTGLGVS